MVVARIAGTMSMVVVEPEHVGSTLIFVPIQVGQEYARRRTPNPGAPYCDIFKFIGQKEMIF
jgi:hypothetical protein